MDHFDELIQSMGSAEFPARLFKLINASITIRHMIVDGFDIHQRPVSLYRHSLENADELRGIRRIYREHNLFASDPVVHRVRDLHSRKPDQSSLQMYIMSKGSMSERMQAEIADRFHLGQRLVILFAFRRRWFAIKLLRDKDQPMLDEQDARKLIDQYPSLLHIVGWHSMFFSGSASLRYQEAYFRYESLIQNLGTSLSVREIEVCARALSGLSNSEIGQNLEIAEGTVRTLRNRAFAKLEIKRLQELSTMCLNLIDAQPQ